MKCAILTVQNVKPGSTWTVLECGGVNVSNGDKIVVPVAIAKRMMVQHGPYLKYDGDCERQQLSGGHYVVEKSTAVVSEPVVVETKKKSEHVLELDPEQSDERVVEPDTMTEPAPVPLETPAERADDRSMFGRGRRRKKK